MCRHGINCYRKNPEHFAENDHPADHMLIKQPSAAAAAVAIAAAGSGAGADDGISAGWLGKGASGGATAGGSAAAVGCRASGSGVATGLVHSTTSGSGGRVAL